jgi:hypothetical protein
MSEDSSAGSTASIEFDGILLRFTAHPQKARTASYWF